MNVLQINSVCGIGSTGRIATDLHTILISQGHQSTIAFGRDAARNCDRAIRIGSKLDNYLHVARTRLLDDHGFGSLAATEKLVAHITTLNPDVIHLHNLHGYYLHIGHLFEHLKTINKPVIWTLHDCWSFTGHCAHFDYVGCDRWKTLCQCCPLTSEYPKSLLLDRSQHNYRKKKSLFTGVHNLTIVTPSKWLAGLVRESFLREYRVAVINNGIDLNVFKPTSSDFRDRYKLENRFIILGVASIWGERKGLKYFSALAEQLRQDETIVLVGVSKEQCKELPNGIVGITKTNSTTELAEIYSAADLFINPTLEDNFPTTNLEALACGTPMVTFNTGGSPESLGHGCGFVVERGDVPGLLEAINTVRKTGKATFANHCRERAEERFDKDARFAEYVDLYMTMLNSGV